MTRAAAAATSPFIPLPKWLSHALLPIIAYDVTAAAVSQRCFAAHSIRAAKQPAADRCARKTTDGESFTVPPNTTHPAIAVGNSQAEQPRRHCMGRSRAPPGRPPSADASGHSSNSSPFHEGQAVAGRRKTAVQHRRTATISS
jgi:hypothetical protein